MGNWAIIVEGHGIHHNHRTDDANVLARDFVRQLEALGHLVDHASFTHSGSDDLTLDDYYNTVDKEAPSEGS